MQRFAPNQIFLIVCLLLVLSRLFFLIDGDSFLEFVFYVLLLPVILIVTTVWTVFRIGLRLKNLKQIGTTLLIAVCSFCIVSFGLNHKNVTAFDWKINKKKRETIVELVKEGQLLNGKLPDPLRLRFNCSPNEITIKERTDTTVTILFYTDRGLNDHYSGFWYTNDPKWLTSLNAKVARGGNDWRLEPNWFEIND